MKFIDPEYIVWSSAFDADKCTRTGTLARSHRKHVTIEMIEEEWKRFEREEVRQRESL